MMRSAGPVTRFRRLSGERKRLLLHAALRLGAASAAVALLPFRHAIRLGSVPVGRCAGVPATEFVWAVETAARWLPWRTMCIERGLAVQRMLRTVGSDAVLHYGARHHPETRKLEAHVWVTLNGKPVIGGEEAAEFAPVAVYPEASGERNR